MQPVQPVGQILYLIEQRVRMLALPVGIVVRPVGFHVGTVFMLTSAA